MVQEGEGNEREGKTAEGKGRRVWKGRAGNNLEATHVYLLNFL